MAAVIPQKSEFIRIFIFVAKPFFSNTQFNVEI